MLKNLSVAAILLAAAIVNASETAENANVFDQPTLNPSLAPAEKPSKAVSSSSSSDSSSSSSSSSSSDSSSSSSSSSSSGSSSSSSDSDSDSSSSSSSSSTDSSSTSGSKVLKAFKKDSGKKWIKKGDVHDVAVMRHKSKVDDKGKKHKKARKQKFATVKNSLKVKSKKPVMITVNDNSIKKGLVVMDGEKKLFKTPKKSYAIVNSGSHDFNIMANKKGKTGVASIQVQEVKVSKKLAKKYKIVSNMVLASDAQELCERFGGNLAEVKESDIKKLIKDAKKLISKGVSEVWIDRVIKKENDEFSYLPTILNLETSSSQADPDNVYGDVTEYAYNARQANKYSETEEKKKYKKESAKIEDKIRRFTDKALDKKDMTTPRAVLCRFD